MSRAIVAFHSDSNHWLASHLRNGFKHCLVAVLDPDAGWIETDFRRGTPTIRLMCEPGVDLIEHYDSIGLLAVETETIDTEFRAPYFVANCVGMVKVVLGVRKPSIVTPYQLWRFLQ